MKKVINLIGALMLFAVFASDAGTALRQDVSDQVVFEQVIFDNLTVDQSLAFEFESNAVLYEIADLERMSYNLLTTNVLLDIEDSGGANRQIVNTSLINKNKLLHKNDQTWLLSEIPIVSSRCLNYAGDLYLAINLENKQEDDFDWSYNRIVNVGSNSPATNELIS